MWLRTARLTMLAVIICAVSVACGSQQSSSDVYTWGYNGFGQLGNGTKADSAVARSAISDGLVGPETPIAISSGANHECVLVQGGRVYCWGDNSQGQLGDGSTTSSSSPVQVIPTGGLAGKSVIWVSAGGNHTCAITVPSAVYCWGDNTYGELGNGATRNSPVPVLVDAQGGFTNSPIREVHSGLSHTCALDTNGSAFCWGDNESGQLGDGTHRSSSRPVVVSPPPDALSDRIAIISAGGSNSCALTRYGAAYCWGDNSHGQLGNGSHEGSSAPTAVRGLGALDRTSVIAISVGGTHVCAVTGRLRLACWGGNSQGQLGNGNTADQRLPVAVSWPNASGRLPFLFVTAGGFHTCAWTRAGQAFCWGGNNFGQLGNGSTVSSSVPTPVLAAHTPLADVILQQLSAGENFTAGLAVQ